MSKQTFRFVNVIAQCYGEKKRGKMKVFSILHLTLVRYVPDKAVTVASNFLTIELVTTCKSFSRAKKARIDVEQPNLIYKYNSHVRGRG